MNISHVFYIDEEGLISETKYNKSLDSLKEDGVTSFYDESIDVYNISGVIDNGKHFVLNNKKELIEMTPKKFEFELKDNLNIFLSFFKNIKSDTFKKDFRDEPNLNYTMEFFAKDYLKDKDFKSTIKSVSKNKFKASFNKLKWLNSMGIKAHKDQLQMRRFISSALTLAYEDLDWTPKDSGSLRTYTDEEDNVHLDTSGAFGFISHNLISLCYNRSEFYKSFEKEKKKRTNKTTNKI